MAIQRSLGTFTPDANMTPEMQWVLGNFLLQNKHILYFKAFDDFTVPLLHPIKKTNIIYTFRLTHDIFRRESLSNPCELHYEVISNKEPLGKGAFGVTSHIKGTMEHRRDGSVRFKDRKKRVVKKQEYKKRNSRHLQQIENIISMRVSSLHAKRMTDCENFSLMVMRLLDGTTVREIIKNDRNKIRVLTTDQRIDYVIRLLHALQYLHEIDILHRDIKPGNLLATDDVVNTVDFGLSSQLQLKERCYCGTPPFIPLEVYEKSEPNEKSDLYSMGMVIAEIFRLIIISSGKKDRHSNKKDAKKHTKFNSTNFDKIPDLSAAHKSSILERIKAMTLTNLDSRCTTIESINDFENIKLERIKESTGHQYDAMIDQAYQIAVGARNELKAAARANPPGPQSDIVLNYLKQITDHPVAINVFLDVIDIKALKGLTTHKAIVAKIYDIFAKSGCASKKQKLMNLQYQLTGMHRYRIEYLNRRKVREERDKVAWAMEYLLEDIQALLGKPFKPIASLDAMVEHTAMLDEDTQKIQNRFEVFESIKLDKIKKLFNPDCDDTVDAIYQTAVDARNKLKESLAANPPVPEDVIIGEYLKIIQDHPVAIQIFVDVININALNGSLSTHDIRQRINGIPAQFTQNQERLVKLKAEMDSWCQNLMAFLIDIYGNQANETLEVTRDIDPLIAAIHELITSFRSVQSLDGRVFENGFMELTAGKLQERFARLKEKYKHEQIDSKFNELMEIVKSILKDLKDFQDYLLDNNYMDLEFQQSLAQVERATAQMIVVPVVALTKEFKINYIKTYHRSIESTRLKFDYLKLQKNQEILCKRGEIVDSPVNKLGELSWRLYENVETALTNNSLNMRHYESCLQRYNVLKDEFNNEVRRKLNAVPDTLQMMRAEVNEMLRAGVIGDKTKSQFLAEKINVMAHRFGKHSARNDDDAFCLLSHFSNLASTYGQEIRAIKNEHNTKICKSWMAQNEPVDFEQNIRALNCEKENPGSIEITDRRQLLRKYLKFAIENYVHSSTSCFSLFGHDFFITSRAASARRMRDIRDLTRVINVDYEPEDMIRWVRIHLSHVQTGCFGRSALVDKVNQAIADYQKVVPGLRARQ